MFLDRPLRRLLPAAVSSYVETFSFHAINCAGHDPNSVRPGGKQFVLSPRPNWMMADRFMQNVGRNGRDGNVRARGWTQRGMSGTLRSSKRRQRLFTTPSGETDHSNRSRQQRSGQHQGLDGPRASEQFDLWDHRGLQNTNETDQYSWYATFLTAF